MDLSSWLILQTVNPLDYQIVQNLFWDNLEHQDRLNTQRVDSSGLLRTYIYSFVFSASINPSIKDRWRGRKTDKANSSSQSLPVFLEQSIFYRVLHPGPGPIVAGLWPGVATPCARRPWCWAFAWCSSRSFLRC